MAKTSSDGSKVEKAGAGRGDIEDALRRNTWNPFERVDPKILQAIHKRQDQHITVHLMDEVGESPW